MMRWLDRLATRLSLSVLVAALINSQALRIPLTTAGGPMQLPSMLAFVAAIGLGGVPVSLDFAWHALRPLPAGRGRQVGHGTTSHGETWPGLHSCVVIFLGKCPEYRQDRHP